MTATSRNKNSNNIAFPVFEDSQFTPCAAPDLTHIISFEPVEECDDWNHKLRIQLVNERSADDDIASGRLKTFDSIDALIDDLRDGN